jgi:hypothetical protein
MTTRDSASLFLDSVVGSSGCNETVATCERPERLACPSGTPFRLSGRMSEDILGDLESLRDGGRESMPFADDGLVSGIGVTFESMDMDLICW